MKENKQFKKNFIWNIIGTGLNAFNSLFFLIIATRINGINEAGIFTIAFSTACIMYMFGVYAGRIYQVTEPDKSITNKEYIANRLITSIIMIILVFIFCLVRKYDLYKTTVFLLLTSFKALESFSDVLYGILQKNEKLEIVGKSFFIKSLFSVLLFIFTDLITKNMILSIISIILVNVLLIFIYDYKNTNKYIEKNESIKIESIIKIFKSGFYTFSIAFLGIYLLNAPKYAIDLYMANDVQTVFGIIVMPATVVGLIAQFLIHPYLNQILKLYEERNLGKLNKLTIKLIFSITGFGVFAAISAFIIGPEVLGIIYGLDLTLYRMGLLIIIISAIIYTIGIIYSSVLTTIRDTFSQFIIYIVLSIFAYISSNIFTKVLGLDGAVWAYLSIMSLQFLIYIIYANIKLRMVFKNSNNIDIITSN